MYLDTFIQRYIVVLSTRKKKDTDETRIRSKRNILFWRLFRLIDSYRPFNHVGSDLVGSTCMRVGSELTMLSRQSVGTYRGNGLTRNSSRNARPQSSQLAKPLWTDPGIKNAIDVRELMSINSKEKFKAYAEIDSTNLSPNLRMRGKRQDHHKLCRIYQANTLKKITLTNQQCPIKHIFMVNTFWSCYKLDCVFDLSKALW